MPIKPPQVSLRCSTGTTVDRCRRTASLINASIAAFGLATLFGALSLRANAADTPAQAAALAPGFIHISCRLVAEHPGMTPGHLVSKVPPRYPEDFCPTLQCAATNGRALSL